MKRRVYLNEYNVPMGNAIYLPYASGLLQAYAQNNPEVRGMYEFMPILFQRDTVENIIAQYDSPAVAGFSVSIWNYELSCAVAREVKRLWPECIIVFGGPSVGEDLSFVDHMVRGEGEKAFLNILLGVDDVAEPEKDIDNYPSPYVSGVFDGIMADNPHLEFQAIIETTRGCPYSCVFCFWGHQGGLYKKFRRHGFMYICAEAGWIGVHKIKYIFVSDSNFGVMKEDIETAKIYADVNESYGYPEKVRVCYGKTAQDSIFETAKVLSEAGLAKAVTLSSQSYHEPTLKAIHRDNIKKEIIESMYERYHKAGIPTYSEFILGLPEENSSSFSSGINRALERMKGNKLFIYQCTVLPNTRLADPEYQRRYGIKTVRVPLKEVHASVRADNMVVEYEDIVIGTDAMSVGEYVQCLAWAWQVQFRLLAKFPVLLGKSYVALAREVVKGKSRCQHDPKFGDIYWEPEEFFYLQAMEHKVGDIKQFAIEKVLYGRKGK